jgi:hypothetical protein
MTGIELVAAERKRQIEEEGWTAKHDDQWVNGELVEAAIAYEAPSPDKGAVVDWRRLLWPWDRENYKPEEDRIRELTKSAALVVAEIDRLIRLRNRREEA